MPLQDTLNYIRAIRNEICTMYDDFSNSLEPITANIPGNGGEIDNLRSLFDNNIVTKSKEALESAQNEYQKRTKPLEEIRSEIQKLKQMENETSQDLANKQAYLNNLHKRIVALNRKERSLQNLKDIVKSYKILTGTNFLYGEDNTSGYVASNGNYETFEFDSECTEEEVTKTLWNLLQQVSHMDAANMVDVTLDNNKKRITSQTE